VDHLTSPEMIQEVAPGLFPGLFPVSEIRKLPEPRRPVSGSSSPIQPASENSELSSTRRVPTPGLLKGRDFKLPELVGRADSGDISVGGCVDNVQVEQVFQLAEIQELPLRTFAALPLNERRLEQRRYRDWLKRKISKGVLSISDLESWRKGDSEAQTEFLGWWQQKEQRRRTSVLRKANRLANCGVTGRRLDCSDHPEEHRFFGRFNCGVRYCRSCGTRIFAELFGKYVGLWPIVERMVVTPGFRSANVIATLDFTAVNLDRMPTPEEIREFNQDVRTCVRLITERLEVSSKEYGFLWCDEFGGWDLKKEAYNTNLHAHGVFVGPYIPYELLLETWVSLRAKKDGARGVFIKKQKLDDQPFDTSEREHRRFARAVGHALKYTGKHVLRSDGKRLAELEAAFHGVRRVHTMGVFYHADVSCKASCDLCAKPCDRCNGHQNEHRCKSHRSDSRCPLCSGYLMTPSESGYAELAILRREFRLDLEETRRKVGRERIFAGPRGDPQ
jgi:hypothetical protein